MLSFKIKSKWWLLPTVFMAASFLSISSYSTAIGAFASNAPIGKESIILNPIDRNRVKIKVKIKTKNGTMQRPTLQYAYDKG